jgi:hypothetical protein
MPLGDAVVVKGRPMVVMTAVIVNANTMATFITLFRVGVAKK